MLSCIRSMYGCVGAQNLTASTSDAFWRTCFPYLPSRLYFADRPAPDSGIRPGMVKSRDTRHRTLARLCDFPDPVCAERLSHLLHSPIFRVRTGFRHRSFRYVLPQRSAGSPGHIHVDSKCQVGLRVSDPLGARLLIPIGCCTHRGSFQPHLIIGYITIAPKIPICGESTDEGGGAIHPALKSRPKA